MDPKSLSGIGGLTKRSFKKRLCSHGAYPLTLALKCEVTIQPAHVIARERSDRGDLT